MHSIIFEVFDANGETLFNGELPTMNVADTADRNTGETALWPEEDYYAEVTINLHDGSVLTIEQVTLHVTSDGLIDAEEG